MIQEMKFVWVAMIVPSSLAGRGERTQPYFGAALLLGVPCVATAGYADPV